MDAQLVAVKKILAIAGEPSGDFILAQVLKELKLAKLDFEVRGLCGDRSSKMGMISLLPLANVSAQGVWDVLIRPIKWGLLILKLHVLKIIWKPDLILFVDFPGLNKRLIGFWKKSVPTYTIAPPQVWAYRNKNIDEYRDMHVQVLFEKDLPYYQNIGAKVVQGHFFPPIFEMGSSWRQYIQSMFIVMPWQSPTHLLAQPGSIQTDSTNVA